MIHETHNNFSETKQEILSFESVNLHDIFLIKKKIIKPLWFEYIWGIWRLTFPLVSNSRGDSFG